MTNPKILERVQALYEAGEVDAERVQTFSDLSIITPQEAAEIVGGIEDE